MPKNISATRTLAWVGATRTCLAVTARVTTSNRSSYSTSSQAGTGGECEGYNTVRPVPFHSPRYLKFSPTRNRIATQRCAKLCNWGFRKCRSGHEICPDHDKFARLITSMSFGKKDGQPREEGDLREAPGQRISASETTDVVSLQAV